MSKFFAVIRQSLGMGMVASRNVAKDRLTVMVMSQRNSAAVASIDMNALQKDVAAVVAKYIKVANNKEASLALRQDGEFDFLEMHFPLDTVVAGPRRI